MGAGKKGVSAHQIHRMLGITYQSAWFLCHRIREAMTDLEPNKSGGPLGGTDKVVEVYGVYHSISEAHLHRYLAEFDFRYNNRSKLGVEDYPKGREDRGECRRQAPYLPRR
jgi:hypothetical protein